ncbi:MAG: polyheme membrane-associated cytochrome C [Alphaproteobacteria bacterium]|nr:polyheme membrane-associated cytochrome C [Alphaproteobacteria bacterium]
MKAFVKFRRLALASAAVGLAMATGLGIASAQMAPLEIPFVDEWAGSPHANGNGEPFNHWNEEGEIPPACARCHSTPGFQDHIGADGTPPGVDRPARIGTVIACVACHNHVTRQMTSVTFPSGIEIKELKPASARCMQCHQGRESTISVNEALKGQTPDAVSEKLQFINIHYRAAGATRYGAEVKGAYEYEGKNYAGFYEHSPNFTQCSDCHGLHSVKVKVAECAGCHKTPADIRKKEDLPKIRKKMTDDYDGDGNTAEGIGEEIDALQVALLAAIQTYAKDVAGTPLLYDSHSYPYFFKDKNGNGKADPGEAIYPNRYKSWTPRLLKAAYNYQFSLKDPGVYTHNPRYVIQTLYDSLADLGTKVKVNMAGMHRPK